MNPVKTLKKATESHENCLLINELDMSNRALHYYKITACNAFFKHMQRIEIVSGVDQQSAVNDYLNKYGRIMNIINVVQLA
jgi:hypothetical protein